LLRERWRGYDKNRQAREQNKTLMFSPIWLWQSFFA